MIPHPKAAPGGPAEPATKASRLRALLASPQLEFLMEAHDGMSARIVEGASFAGIWASGLSISTALGVRDNNEASWTQVLEVLEFMSDATTVPILVDGDTGYGNFNNLRRVVRKLCQRDIAGICIEDKLFPKTNSFIGENQPLADMDEFCGKIKAGKDSQTDPDFQIVARVEALIAGWGLDEALRRAEAYHGAGADAVLIHSKRADADEVLAFKRAWGDRGPVVLVPTKYYATPTQVFRDAGISTVIWANHNMRAAITAMQEVCSQIRRDESLAGVEERIVSVGDVFAFSGNDELAEAERRYLPKTGQGTRAVLIAASRGADLGELTAERPKCMIEVRGRPLLARLVDTLRDEGVRDITVVRGYCKDKINLPSIHTVDNDLFAHTGEAASLSCALDRIQGDCVIAYGDILFRHHILDQLLDAAGDIVVTVDALWRQRTADQPARVRDLVVCSRPFDPDLWADDPDDGPARLVRLANDIGADEAHGEWMGLAKVSDAGARLVREELAAMAADGTLQQASLLDLITRLMDKGQVVDVVYVTGQWLDVDVAADLRDARDFL
ncbi:MAG: phosphoenolpyruvate mutase [Hyphomicrobiales bacterium]|nr:phosphoenolpyruvate mutase [Hyphomicrobiales bacterium]MCP5373108.1 phosphoenolpyruvate mutase [Hyphomicrobiales bacterium]